MQDRSSSSPSVVVGVDGSRSAIDAALWAVDEAVSRDVPLRLVYAIEPAGPARSDPHDTARELARAEVAVKYAVMAVESTDKPVKIEVEILQERPTRALVDASRWASLLCVGSMGLKHSAQGRIGATAAALASSARCPVAVVRGHDPIRAERQWVVAEVNESPVSDGGVLRRALEEAQLRDAPLRVLMAWQSRNTDIHDGNGVADGNRQARAQLDRRLAQWTKRYPDLDVQAVAVHGSTLHYLSKNADSIQLLVVGHERAQGITALLGPPGYAALHNANCSVLICEPQNVL
jgi:nucleotide-binding universal stress UspA family protein